MEYDDGTGASMTDHMTGALFRGERPVEIRAQHIPHNNSIVKGRPLQQRRLESADPPIRRTEQIRIDILSRLVYIFKILLVGSLPAIEVVLGMIADTVAFQKDPLINLRV